MAAARVTQISSSELSILVSGKAKYKQTKATTECLLIPKLKYVDWWMSGMILSLTEIWADFDPG